MASTALTDAQITEALAQLDGWERDGDQLTRTFKFDNYLAGTSFASAVGVIAEGFDHHPDLFIGYKKVMVSFTTHDAGSKITQKDVDIAKAINALGYPRA
jgi:4a-hydroxytetrahydrobiopterin dehydratase